MMAVRLILYLAILTAPTTLCAEPSKPNIVFILIDDVGWADFNYNIGGKSAIPTPNIDRLAGSGLKLKSHYVHPTCTPSRAALMTGRYAVNTGLPFAMFPGSVAGLPEDMATMPQLMRKAGYSAHMVGKWHLGHAQWKQTPVGRGFETHTGSFMWDLESYTKLMWQNPVRVNGADWARAYENGSLFHKAEPRHATIAITEEAVIRMKEHESDKPLFLYVSFNAAHSPLQPEPEWEAECSHIPHLWRRQYCGMLVGLDLAIGRLVKEAKDLLGENTVVVVSPDNGGSVWFGGLNAPLRSGKLTPFEGGVRVPAFAVDLSGKYLKMGGIDYNHIFHISDWLPTFLSWAGAAKLVEGLGLDGLDQSKGLKTNTMVRNDVLLELFTSSESHYGSHSEAYREGKYKIIHGNVRDPHWYTEPTRDHVATSDQSFLPIILEYVVRLFEFIFGNGPCDMMPHAFTFSMLLFNKYSGEAGTNTMLFDLEKDPEERNDISSTHPEIINKMLEKLQDYKDKSPYHPRYWMVNPSWTDSFVAGDCSGQSVLSEGNCRFAHPWVPDSADLKDEEALGLRNASEGRIVFIRKVLIFTVLSFVLIFFLVLKKCYGLLTGGVKEKKN